MPYSERQDMIRIAFCDDEKTFHKEIGELINKYNVIKHSNVKVESFLSGVSLLKSSEVFDIIFLDVDMPDVNGIEVGYSLMKRHDPAKVILLTSHSEVYKEGFRINAFRFVTKPIDEDEFFGTLDEAVGSLLGRIPLKSDDVGQQHGLLQKDINYIMADGSRTIIFTFDRSFSSERSMAEWESLLDERLFARTHRSYIVNMSEIEKYSAEELLLFSGEKIAISRRLKKKFREKYIDYDLKYR